MFMYAVKKPAAAAAAALGEDGTAVFCEGSGLLFASARGEEPDVGITTAIFNVEKGDIHDGDRWFPGAGSIAEVVFDMPAPLGEKLAGRLEGSVFLIDYFRDKIASLGEECDVITGDQHPCRAPRTAGDARAPCGNQALRRDEMPGPGDRALRDPRAVYRRQGGGSRGEARDPCR